MGKVNVGSFALKLIPVSVLAGLIAWLASMLTGFVVSAWSSTWGAIIAMILAVSFFITAGMLRKGDENWQEFFGLVGIVGALFAAIGTLMPIPALSIFNLQSPLTYFGLFLALGTVILAEMLTMKLLSLMGVKG